MIDSVLVNKKASLKIKITVKSLITLAVIALAVTLPQITHLLFGAGGGVKLLPMYLPVILGGCVLGFKWGLAAGLFAPVVSFLITSAFGSPMPALARLPFMAAELSIMAAVSGAFSKKIAANGFYAFLAVPLAFLCGRGAFMLLVVAFNALVPFTPAVIWAQIKAGAVAVAVQSVAIPLIVLGLRAALTGGDGNE